jgi:hypothetical protein
MLTTFHRRTAVIALIGILNLVSTTAAAAQSANADATLRDVLLGQWTDVGERLIAMAEDFPDAKYDFRPNGDVRTFADVMRHVAFWNTFVQKSARGEKADGSANELSKAEYPSKPQIVAALKRTFADATAELKKQGDTMSPRQARLWVTFTEHSGEHYGQLVVYYRLNGIVPPASRPAK